jgi:predicted O-methyltransferase YrrM
MYKIIALLITLGTISAFSANTDCRAFSLKILDREFSLEESARRPMQATPLGVVEAGQRRNFPRETPYQVFLVKMPCTDWLSYQNQVLSHQTKLEGWCTPEKARRMMDLIYEVKPEVCVEIGVFGGASIYPTASALKFLNHGQVYAIDPWMNSYCLDGYTQDNPNYQWWSRVDLDYIYLAFVNMLDYFQLSSYCTIMRMTGLIALDRFADESIDILHIDGNHTENIALGDVQMYLPKVKKGGYIWLDDANWPTTRLAQEFLLANCTRDESRSTDEYLLFKK